MNLPPSMPPPPAPPPPPPPPPPSFPGGAAGGFPGAVNDDPLVSGDLGSWFGKGLGVLGRSWKSMVVIQLIGTVVIAVLVGAFSVAVIDDIAVETSDNGATTFDGGELTKLIAGGVGIAILSFVLQGLVSLALTRVMVDNAAGRPTNYGAAWSLAARRLGPWLGWSIVTGIITGIGFILCIAPGIWLGLTFGCSLLGVIVFERENPFDRSFKLIKGMFWPMLGRVLLLMVVTVIYSLIVGVLFSSLSSSDSAGTQIAAQILVGIVQIPLTLFTAALYVITYAELRNREQPGLTSAMLAEAMDR